MHQIPCTLSTKRKYQIVLQQERTPDFLHLSGVNRRRGGRKGKAMGSFGQDQVQRQLHPYPPEHPEDPCKNAETPKNHLLPLSLFNQLQITLCNGVEPSQALRQLPHPFRSAPMHHA